MSLLSSTSVRSPLVRSPLALKPSVPCLTSYRNCCLPPRSQTKPLVPPISAPPFYPLSPRSHLLFSPFTLPSAFHLGPGCSSWLAPSSNSGSTLDSPRCPASAYSLPFIYNKPSLPLYFFFFFIFIQLLLQMTLVKFTALRVTHNFL